MKMKGANAMVSDKIRNQILPPLQAGRPADGGTPLPIDIYMRRDWNSWINSLEEKRPQQLEYL